MEQKLTEEDGRRALKDHVVDKANAARAKHGDIEDVAALMAVLSDAEVVRYPTELRFGRDRLERGEFAHAEAMGKTPADGFWLHVHPDLEDDDVQLPLAVAYHLVTINYGDIVSSEEAELFGAHLLGLDVDTYYDRLCRIADRLQQDA